MKILYVSQYFPPEMGAPAARAAELSRYWAAAGHEVTVLTGFPNHPTGVVPPEYRGKFRRLVAREKTDGVNVVRTWLLPFPNRKAYERMLNYSSFCISAASTGLFLSRPDVAIGTSPQLLVALAGYWLARRKRVPFVFEVRDLWPESLAAVGMGNANSPLHRALANIAGFLYRRSDRIVVVTPAFQDYLVKHWRVPREKILVIENGVESKIFAPEPFAGEPATALRRELGAEGKFVVSYIGISRPDVAIGILPQVPVAHARY
jgi:glycosyltransferase involved in cell wall biosynthesis